MLNARYHEQEAQIIAEAGVPGAVTIATNMAGRGTDIQLGGNVDMRWTKRAREPPMPRRASAAPARPTQGRSEIEAEIAGQGQVVRQAGGLYVLGTERHESRRIDNQLRGRTGRQGDPGPRSSSCRSRTTCCASSAGERARLDHAQLGLKEGEAITHRWLNKALDTAQPRSSSATSRSARTC